MRTRECETFPLQEEFPYVEVPFNATLDYTYYLGSSAIPGNYVEMNYYSDSNERGKRMVILDFACRACTWCLGNYRGVWTAKDCIPYVHSYISAYPTPHYHRST